MAKMVPASLPSEVLSNPGKQAEISVYEALKDQLDDSFTVFYSLEWNGSVSANLPVQDGEADFVVCHPEGGFLVLEVKGGTVTFDPDENQWNSGSFGGQIFRIADPFKQACKSCHGLVGRLSKFRSQHGSLKLFHAAVFPDCLMRSDDLPSNTVPDLTIDAEGMRDLEHRILIAFAYWLNGCDLRGPSYDEVLAALKRIYKPPLEGYRNMALEILEHQKEFDRLTQKQLSVIEMVASNRKLLVRGCAGSGKTFLAKRLAIKRSQQSERVLVLCFNNLLASFLRRDLDGIPNIEATNFHALCEQIAKSAGVPLPRFSNGDASDYYERLVECAVTALKSNPEIRFDTIIIDEGQDFELDWWLVVEALLAGPQSSLTVFTDANQHLYLLNRGIPSSQWNFAEVLLDENIRNTQAIHQVGVRFFKGDTVPTASGPKGTEPKWITADSTQDQLSKLEEVLTHLIHVEKIQPRNIAVLTPKGAQSTILKDIEKIGRFDLMPYEDADATDISWSTIRKFKGLESSVVILIELDQDVINRQRLRELLYVGVTRARDHLVLIGDKETLNLLQSDGLASF